MRTGGTVTALGPVCVRFGAAEAAVPETATPFPPFPTRGYRDARLQAHGLGRRAEGRTQVHPGAPASVGALSLERSTAVFFSVPD